MKMNILLALNIVTLTACSNGQSSSYTLDMFSLISFALAIASILFASFALWLSWELYKKSTAASEKTQEAVIRIESAVLGIKGDITEIVKRAVSYWIDDNPEEQKQVVNLDITEKVEEMYRTLQALTSEKPEASEIEKKLKEILDVQKQEIEKLNSSLFDAKVKNIFPTVGSISAITLNQQILENSKNKKLGQLIITINRPLKIATATGKFSPAFENTPTLSVKLLSSPYGDSTPIHITSGLGQNSDFNVHLHIPGNFLVEGEYIVEYDYPQSVLL
jgi:CHASE3 domain sensor protein